MKTRTASLLAALVLAAAAMPAAASSGADLRLEPAPINRLDNESLQRGARTFVNYCLNCHSAKYMRYNRLTDIGLDLSQIQDNLVFTGRYVTRSGKTEWVPSKIGDTMTVAMEPADAKEWLKVAPPDLTVEARVRGADWLYNYFLAFYRDEASASGWNNLVFRNVGMPHVLWQYSGTNRLVTAEFADHEKAQAAAIAARGIALTASMPDHKYVVETLAIETPGTMNPVEYRAMVADLVNFLDYMSEPAKNKRISLGIVVLLYLAVLFFFAYWLKREYWKDVH
jgi:ubiquinol-cytochrome c reductase cytochrome c1 subunit